MLGQVHRQWIIPKFFLDELQLLEDKEPGYGKSYFWYCCNCSLPYAWAKIVGTPWSALAGLCFGCPSRVSRWLIPGSIEDGLRLSEPVPRSILLYQLQCELAFTHNPAHPHYQEYLDAA